MISLFQFALLRLIHLHFLLPTVAIANNLACKGLDRIEKTLPILHQPSEQVCTGLLTNSLHNYGQSARAFMPNYTML